MWRFYRCPCLCIEIRYSEFIAKKTMYLSCEGVCDGDFMEEIHFDPGRGRQLYSVSRLEIERGIPGFPSLHIGSSLVHNVRSYWCCYRFVQ